MPVSRKRGFESFAAYFATTAAEKARNGHFVVKASIGQLAVLAAHGILERILPHSRFILTERMDKLAQAISWQIAAQSGVFTSHDSTANRPEPVYNRDVLRHDLEGLTQLHATIALFMALNGIVPLHLTYEFLTTRRKQAGRFACEFLGQPALEIDPTKVKMKRQATRRNAEWRERFLSGD